MKEKNKSLLPFSDSIQIDKSISEEDKHFIEMKILGYLGKHIERYTMGDSTSIPIEKAEELLHSICFLLNLQLREILNPDQVLIKEDIEALIKASWMKIELLIAQGKSLLDTVKKTSPNIENISYNCTLEEIGQFFKKYDYRFFSHNIDCSIDYQLSNPVSEKLQGIEYINEYLKVLLIENEFCLFFHKDNIVNILNSYCSDYKELLINIFEPVLTNALGLYILSENILTLEISAMEREMLLMNLSAMSKAEIIDLLRNSAKKVCNIIGIVDNYKIEYIKKTSVNLYPRIAIGLSTGNIDNIFLSFNHKQNSNKKQFIDNSPMDNERLRMLINELNDCRYVSDKIAMVKEEVHSLSDLVEVLAVCFWGDESLDLFKSLSKEELYIIKDYLDSKGESYYSDSKWEVNFINYIKLTTYKPSSKL